MSRRSIDWTLEVESLQVAFRVSVGSKPREAQGCKQGKQAAASSVIIPSATSYLD